MPPKILLACLALVLAPLVFGGCASTPKEDSAKEPVSSLPWNTPAKWERSMPLGGTGIGY
ncbi:MAG: hypothetical protein HUU04_10705 [Verrucomicrobiae bacterium]|nr:hypothetical protein [Verrucomicrobiae bacterium]